MLTATWQIHDGCLSYDCSALDRANENDHALLDNDGVCHVPSEWLWNAIVASNRSAVTATVHPSNSLCHPDGFVVPTADRVAGRSTGCIVDRSPSRCASSRGDCEVAVYARGEVKPLRKRPCVTLLVEQSSDEVCPQLHPLVLASSSLSPAPAASSA